MSRQEEVLYDLRSAMRAAEEMKTAINNAVLELRDIVQHQEEKLNAFYAAVAQAAETLNRAADEQVPGIAEEV